MPSDEDGAHFDTEEGVAMRSWAKLPPAEKAAAIELNVRRIVLDSHQAAKKIVDAAMADFARDYKEIKSKSMRRSVLRNLSERTGVERIVPTVPESTKASRPGFSVSEAFNAVLALFIG